MNNRKQSYLKSLWQWGEDTKRALSASQEGISSYRIKELEAWQDKVKKGLSSMADLGEQELISLRDEGERMLSEMRAETNHGLERAVPYGKHRLPPLPYAYDALEPYINQEIMRLHHDEHHQSYVDGLNKAEKELYKAKQKKEDNLIKHWLREQAFHGSGHNLHTIFWFNMTPESGKKPVGEIAKRITKDFGSWGAFKDIFTKAAASVEGVGWAILAWNPRSGRLVLQTFEKHQLFQIADIIPLLVLDMWEHAYYLQYKTNKNEYIDNWWNVVNWDDVNKRYMEGKKVKWPLF